MSKKPQPKLENPILAGRVSFLTSGVQPVEAPAATPDGAPVRQPVAAETLLERYLAASKKGSTVNEENIKDMMYLPPELYDVLMTVWHTRKRTKRGIKKSHLLIEALLLHPEIAAELRLRGILL